MVNYLYNSKLQRGKTSWSSLSSQLAYFCQIVEVCPVDCFYEGPNFLVINPDECIDCALCEPECPAEAIFSEDEVPADQEEFFEINAELSQVWPNISEKKDPLPDAEEWDGVKDKLQYLER